MNATETLAEIAATHPGAAQVFYEHRLDFCCGGRRPLADACEARGLDADAVLAEVAARDAVTIGTPRWDTAPLTALVAHIVSTYHARLRVQLPSLVAMARKVEVRHFDKPACPLGLAAHLAEMEADVLSHLEKEEQVLFPMILAGAGRNSAQPVHVMELEHEHHGVNLQKVRDLTSDFTPPDAACTTWRALYLGLAQLEQELMEHIHLENNVLFRRALTE